MRLSRYTSSWIFGKHIWEAAALEFGAFHKRRNARKNRCTRDGAMTAYKQYVKIRAQLSAKGSRLLVGDFSLS